VQNAGISPEAVSRKGQEERNKENRQRDSRMMAGQRNGIAERDWWLVRQAPVREDGTMLVERQYVRRWRRLVIAVWWRKVRSDVFVQGFRRGF
jgi:hypothetical protein